MMLFIRANLVLRSASTTGQVKSKEIDREPS
jgi:hypothetical protein